jgi:hypothetical protein
VKRTARSLLILVAAVDVATCGKRGDPLPPLRPVPAPLSDVTARRVDNRVELRFRIPATNADNSTPPAIERVEIFAMPSPQGATTPPPVAQVTADVNLRGRIDVRRPEPAPTASPTPSPTPAPAPPTPTPAVATPAPGDLATFVDTLAPAAGAVPPTLNYVLVEVAGRRRVPSRLISVALLNTVAPPHDVASSYDERTLTLRWQPGADGQSARVYDVDETGRVLQPDVVPPIVKDATLAVPVEFAKPHCFAVRGVEISAGVELESVATAPACVTPIDTFPPPAPADLRAFPGADAITLTWSAVSVPDLAGYVVLRGEGPGDTLQPLAEVVSATNYVDRQVQPGTIYRYAVRAVDNAPKRNESPESNRQQAAIR